ncbi:MAG: ionic transporter y4hA [Balneola sp.]
MKYLSYWDRIIPILAIITYASGLFDYNIFGQFVVVALLIGSILSAVHHSELIAHKVGEPFGTIILAVSITIIEVALIISLMLAGGEKAMFLARDTVFSAVMILLTIVIGICIVIGGFRHFEQKFDQKSVNTTLVSLVAILVLTLVLPNFSEGGKYITFSKPQLILVSISCLVIYSAFIYIQTIRHRNYFLTEKKSEEYSKENSSLILNIVFLIISLIITVLLAKTISPTIENYIIEANLPHSLLGIIIALVILLPEGIAATKAAYKDDIQSSLNLSLGSALAAIGLTIPSVAVVSTIFKIDIVLGLNNISMVLLGLTIFTVMLSLSKGRTNILYGIILILLFIIYVFTIIHP